jgi:CubicO group peptidase (beta-lactamase class C family)
MKRSISVALLSLTIALSSYGAAGIHPQTGPDVVPAIPAACNTPGTWPAAAACLDAIVALHPGILPGAVIGYQADGEPAKVYSKGAGFANNSVVSMASTGKPFTYAALVKLVQDHYASPACTPMTANCVFPQKFQTPLRTALLRLDTLRGTTVVRDWFDPVKFDDPAGTQAAWKKQITIQHVAQMTSGFPRLLFTGYVFCTGATDSTCPATTPDDVTCNLNDPDPEKAKICRQARLYNQYLTRVGTPIPNGCRPRPATGPRLYDFDNHYFGNVEAPYKLMRQFERRYVGSPGLTGECVFQVNQFGSSWEDSRTVPEAEIAKFYLGVPLIDQPGTKFNYAQHNLYIAALLIQSLSGQRFDDYLDAKFFTPLNMTDTSFKVHPGSTQYQRLVDIKRILTTRARTLPDLASPVQLDSIYGTDKNWDEPRQGWTQEWPEGGSYSTATDVLRFLDFIRTGKAPNGQVILNAESLQLITSTSGTVSARTYAFNTTAPGVIGGNGYFGTMMRRNLNTCKNITVLPQIVVENSELDVQQSDYQYIDALHLRGALIRMLEGIPTACSAASPFEP